VTNWESPKAIPTFFEPEIFLLVGSKSNSSNYFIIVKIEGYSPSGCQHMIPSEDQQVSEKALKKNLGANKKTKL